MRYISDLHEGEQLIVHYLCKKKEIMKSKSGKNYMSLVLADKTGEIVGRVWTLNNDIQAFEAGDVIKIDTRVNNFNDELQLNIAKIRKSMQGEFLEADYIPTTERDIDEIYKATTAFIDSFQNKYLQQLMSNIFVHNEDIRDTFLRRSAAKSNHHAYMGGLCEHTLNVAQICEFLAPRYKFVNRDLLISAALLHDLGKIYELSDFPDNDYTDSGKLIGHIVMCCDLISTEAAKIEGFPEKLKHLLTHCVISHHGKQEYGSPVLPKIIEALILSYADDMDAKIKMFETALEKVPQNTDWVDRKYPMDRDLRKSSF
ncbi:MAG: HD domain-containing protein [Defluviitaleaceae bacterium]|nr:HD domain-containing protein [Defluviitaleaceae bacterium]